MTGTLGDFDAIIGGGEIAPGPFLVFQAEGGLGGNFLREKTVCRGCRNAPRRSVRLVEKTAILKVGHDVADGRCAQRFFEALGNGARRDRLACLDIRADEVGQNLPVTPFLERCVSHSSTPTWRVPTTIVGTLSSPGQSLAILGSRSKLITIPCSLLTCIHQSALSICARCSLSE